MRKKRENSYPHRLSFREKIDFLLNLIEIHVKKFDLNWTFEDKYKDTLVIFEINLMIVRHIR